jgi:hypothetical protein
LWWWSGQMDGFTCLGWVSVEGGDEQGAGDDQAQEQGGQQAAAAAHGWHLLPSGVVGAPQRVQVQGLGHGMAELQDGGLPAGGWGLDGWAAGSPVDPEGAGEQEPQVVVDRPGAAVDDRVQQGVGAEDGELVGGELLGKVVLVMAASCGWLLPAGRALLLARPGATGSPRAASTPERSRGGPQGRASTQERAATVDRAGGEVAARLAGNRPVRAGAGFSRAAPQARPVPAPNHRDG